MKHNILKVCLSFISSLTFVDLPFDDKHDDYQESNKNNGRKDVDPNCKDNTDVLCSVVNENLWCYMHEDTNM